MEQLTAPSGDAVAVLTGEVGFADRLVAGRMHPRAGVQAVALYSLNAAVALLGSPYPQVDLGELELWVRRVFGDRELADRISAAANQPGTGRDRLLKVRDLIGWRLVQCRQAGRRQV